MRSAGGTKLGPPSVVVVLTKSTIACFACPSFHEGSGSPAASACAETEKSGADKAGNAAIVLSKARRPILDEPVLIDVSCDSRVIPGIGRTPKFTPGRWLKAKPVARGQRSRLRATPPASGEYPDIPPPPGIAASAP